MLCVCVLFGQAAGPYGRGLIEKYVTRRFPASSPEAPLSDAVAEQLSAGSEMDLTAAVPAMDKPAVSDYLYQMIVAPSSGDRALSLILKPGAFAHQPLADRLPAALAPQPHPPVDGGVPTVFVYGVADWMDRHAGASTAAAMIARGGAACSIRVRGAGHQLFCDNPAGFHESVQAAMTFPTADAGQASRQQWAQHTAATFKQLIIDT